MTTFPLDCGHSVPRQTICWIVKRYHPTEKVAGHPRVTHIETICDDCHAKEQA